MSRRELLTEVERAQLFGVPVDEASLARHYTLSAEDLELLLAKRGAHNILGAAVQLCLLRHPGFGLRSDEPVDDALRDDSNIALAVIGIRDDVNDHGIASSKAHAIEPGFLPLIGLADVAGDHLSRLVPGVALDAISRHIARRGRGCVASA